MQYELNKQYELAVIDIRKDSAGYDYIALHDEDPSKEYRVYNIIKCQYDSLPEKIYVRVKSVDAFGKIKFRQDEERLIKDHYAIGKLYAFEVTDVKQDYKSDAPYYIIEDEFMEHHFYFKGEQKYQIGDNCILEVDGFTDKGYLKLKEVKHVDETKVEKSAETKNDDDARLASLWDSLPVLANVEENEIIELKTSISFPAGGNGEADIDKQLYVILKELTAFMNTKGGVLYIGVHDKTKKIVGINADYAHLNEGEDDFNGSYSAGHDGYELKIRNAMDRLCPSVANSLTTIEFPDIDGHEFCKITVKQARRPIFLSGTQLYVRQGNRLKLLRGDEITFFVTGRMTVSIKDVIDTEDMPSATNGLDIEKMTKIMRDLVNERRQLPPTDLPPLKPLGEVDYWIIWYDDGKWKRSRKESDEKNVHIQVPVYKAMSDPVVTFCYETGRVNTIKLSDLRKKVKLDDLQEKGWSKTGDKPKNIFVMHPTDYLVGYSVDHNGTECVKLHAISDYNPTASPANQGSPFLPDGWKPITYATLGAEHKKGIAHLIVTKAKRSSEPGTPLNSVSLKDEIDYLQKALTRRK